MIISECLLANAMTFLCDDLAYVMITECCIPIVFNLEVNANGKATDSIAIRQRQGHMWAQSNLSLIREYTLRVVVFIYLFYRPGQWALTSLILHFTDVFYS